MGRAIEVPTRISGSRVALRPLELRDVVAWAAAFVDDPELGAAWGVEEDPSEEDLGDRVGHAAEGAKEGRWVELAIADLSEDRLLGTVILHSFDWRHEHAEVGFWLIQGERGRGLATEAVELMVDWGFGKLGLHRVEMITLPALPHIDSVLGLAERLGFEREGVMRERNFERGRRLDTLILAVLRENWDRRAAAGA